MIKGLFNNNKLCVKIEMKTFISFALLLILVPTQVWSGDYMLTISDNPNAQCTERARKIHKWCEEERAKGNEFLSELSWPIYSTEEVISSIKQYFDGKEPSIKILLGAFSNGHLEFCTEDEKMKIYHALKDIERSGKATNKRHLADFINILNIKEN